MANPKHTIHVGVTAVALVLGAILSIAIGDPTVALIFSGSVFSGIGYWFTVALIFSGSVFSGIGYWLGAAAQRRHG